MIALLKTLKCVISLRFLLSSLCYSRKYDDWLVEQDLPLRDDKGDIYQYV